MIVALCNTYKNIVGKVISVLYQSLVMSRGTSTLYIRDKLEIELKMKLTKDDWYNICKVQQTTNSSRMWKEFCWKNTVRFFNTPMAKSRFSSAQQPCWRLCGEKNVDHTHVFWKCTQISIGMMYGES